MNIRTVEISGIRWFTDAKGKVKPVLALTKLVKFNDVEFDGISIDDIGIITKRNLRVASKLKVKVSSDGNIAITNLKVKDSPKEPLLLEPTECPSCGDRVANYVCQNIICKAKGTTPILRLLSRVAYASHEELLDYVEKFKTAPDQQYSNIGSLIDYLYFFNSIKETIGTTGRPQCLSNPNAEKWELALLAKLKTGLSNKEFWELLGLNVSESDLEKLNTIDYNNLLNNEKLFDRQLRSLFVEQFDAMPFLRDILYHSQSIKRLIKALNWFKNDTKE
jgi:hypothetical protein